MKTNITIHDVAKFAGVSKTTVSKYLNNVPYVSLDAKKRIESAIQELGFKPNSLAQGLANKASGLIGLIISDFENTLNMELIKSIETEASKEGYSIVLISTNDNNYNEQRIPELLTQKYGHLDGVIVASAREGGVELSELTRTFEHVVLVHRHIPTDSIDYVVIDGYMGAKLAVEYLINLGHKRIALISGPTDILQFRERIRGFKETLAMHELLDQGAIIEVGQSLEEGYRGAERAVFEHAPTAIFTLSDILAFGVLDAAKNYGWNIPGDLSLIGFNNSFFCRLARVPLTTIDSRIRDIGKIGFQRLFEKMNGINKDVKQIVLQPSLIVHESCAPSQK